MLDNGEDAALERYAEASEGRPLAPMTAYRFDGEVNDWVEGQAPVPPHDSPLA